MMCAMQTLFCAVQFQKMSDELYAMVEYHQEEVVGMEYDDAGIISHNVPQVSCNVEQHDSNLSSVVVDNRANSCLLCSKDTNEHAGALSRGTEKFIEQCYKQARHSCIRY